MEGRRRGRRRRRRTAKRFHGHAALEKGVVCVAVLVFADFEDGGEEVGIVSSCSVYGFCFKRFD